MNPIISPLWVYLIHLSNTIRIAAGVVDTIAVIAWIAMFMYKDCEFIGNPDPSEEKQIRSFNKSMKRCVIVMFICSIILIVVPDQKTMYEMLAASMITPDNISAVEEHVIELIKQIANAVYDAGK